MVKFVDSTAGDEAAVRADRGAHAIQFEEGDQGPALRARSSHLSWTTIDGLDALPYGEFFDIAGRILSMRDETQLAAAFHADQVSATPLTRSWQLLLPGMGLGGADAGEM